MRGPVRLTAPSVGGRLVWRRRVLRYLVGAGLIATASGVAWGARLAPLHYPPPSGSFELDIGPGRDTFTLGVRSTTERSHQVTLTTGRAQTSFVHRRRAAVYVIEFGRRADPHGRLHVTLDPPAAVVVDPPPTRARAIRPDLVWGPGPPPLRLPVPVAADRSRADAEASVDETDVYGLRLFGVPVRVAPRVASVAVATVSHGDRLHARCWAMGDPVTNGFDGNPVGQSYESDVWFLVDTPAGRGYIPDVRFARRGLSDRLGLPPCP